MNHVNENSLVDCPTPGTFAARMIDTMKRLNLDQQGLADYLGVPIFTLRKWIRGERRPASAVIRLLDVLGMIESFVPVLHDSLINREPISPPQ